MRFVSWNVNGLRAVMKKGFPAVFDELNADVFALQETKLQEGQIDLDLPGYTQSWSYAERKGYSGTAVFSKEVPLQVIHEVGVPELDTEGRVVICEFEHLWFVNVYTPNSQNELARIDHRMHWDDVFREVCQGLEQGILPDGSKGNAKPVVMCGDFNVAHEPIDLKNPRTNVGNPGFFGRRAREIHGAFGSRLCRHLPQFAPYHRRGLYLVELSFQCTCQQCRVAHRLLSGEPGARAARGHVMHLARDHGKRSLSDLA